MDCPSCDPIIFGTERLTTNCPGVTEFTGRTVASPFTTFHCDPSDLIICSPKRPLAMACGEIGVEVPERGIGGNDTAPVTWPASRSTILMDSPPVLATYRVL